MSTNVTEKKRVIGKMLDEIEAAMDHMTAAFDLAHENEMPTKSEELLALKKHLMGLRKELNWQYENIH